MNKHSITLAMLALVALSGSSCHDYDKEDPDNAAKPPSAGTGNSARTGINIVPLQQLQPSTMPIPRM